MKKIIFSAVVFLVLLFWPGITAFAETEKDENYDIFNTEELENSLSEETKKYLDDFSLKLENGKFSSSLTPKQFILHITDFLKEGIKDPLKIFFLISGIILAVAAADAFKKSGDKSAAAVLAGTLAIAAAGIGDVMSAASAAVSAIKAVSEFMFAFIPVFTAIVAVSGKTATSAASGALLLGATQAVSAACTYLILPIISGFSALFISSSFSPLTERSSLPVILKKAALWILSLVSTLFLGILGIQTVISSASDTVGLKTAKFIVGTCVPVAGPALAEAASTVAASVSLVRSSVGAYAIAALVFTILPVLLQVAMLRGCFLLSIAVSETFALPKMTSLLKAIDSVLSVLFAILLLISGLFVIALGIVVNAGKSV